VVVADTVGAGDTFQAALLAWAKSGMGSLNANWDVPEQYRWQAHMQFIPTDGGSLTTLEDLLRLNDVELFDTRSDPHEMTNLAAPAVRNRELLLAMNEKLNRLIDTEVGEDRGQMMPGGIDAGWEVTPETMAGA